MCVGHTRVVGFANAVVGLVRVEGDVHTLKTLGLLGFRLTGVHLAIRLGEFDVVGEGVSRARGCSRSTRTALISAQTSSDVDTRYRNASRPSTIANTLLVALAELSTCAT